MTTLNLTPARKLLAEIEEATGRAERQHARCKADGADHFRQNMAMAHETMDESSLDRLTAHARALAAAQA